MEFGRKVAILLEPEKSFVLFSSAGAINVSLVFKKMNKNKTQTMKLLGYTDGPKSIQPS